MVVTSLNFWIEEKLNFASPSFQFFLNSNSDKLREISSYAGLQMLKILQYREDIIF